MESGAARPAEAHIATKTSWAIAGARHAGITVSDLDRSLAFYCRLLGMELLWRRLFEEAEVREIPGVADATAIDIAIVRVPGSELVIELLEFKGCERQSGSMRPCDYGTGHICLYVRGIETLHAELRSRGVAFRSDGPIEISAGANRGGKSLYALDPDGYHIEFHEPARSVRSVPGAGVLPHAEGGAIDPRGAR